MATLTRSWSNSGSAGTRSYKATHTMTDLYEMPVSGDTFYVSIPTRDITVTGTGMPQYISGLKVYYKLNDIRWYIGSSYSTPGKVSSFQIPSVTASKKLNTSDFFNDGNPTISYIDFPIYWDSYLALTDDHIIYDSPGTELEQMASTTRVVLNAPPTFTASNVYYNTPYVYANRTTAKVDVSALAAQYGGYITEATLTIGQQTDMLTGDDSDILSSGTLEIALASAGTFTPTVTVTDSRGQITTISLPAITVNQYVAPSISFTATRTDETGAVDDEGACALLNTSISWTSAIATLTAPTVSITDMDGTAITATTTWYTDSALTTAITDWTTVSSMPIYGLIDNTNHDVFDSQESYRITVTPNCSLGSGTALAQTLPTAFYTIDFLAGGHGIAFGAPSTQTGFYVNMDANFLQGIDVTGDAAISGNETVGGNAVITGTTETDDVLLDLSDYQTSGSVDKAIYDALVSLGWDSDVIV